MKSGFISKKGSWLCATTSCGLDLDKRPQVLHEKGGILPLYVENIIRKECSTQDRDAGALPVRIDVI